MARGIVGSRLAGIRHTVVGDRSNRLQTRAIGTETIAAFADQVAGDHRPRHRTLQGVVELVEVGDQDAIGVDARLAVIGNGVEQGLVEVTAQPHTQRIGLDALGREEGDPVRLFASINTIAQTQVVLTAAVITTWVGVGQRRLAVGEEVRNVLYPSAGEFAGRIVGIHRLDQCIVIVGRTVAGVVGQRGEPGLGIGGGHPDIAHSTRAVGEGHDAHHHVTEVVVAVDQTLHGILGQRQLAAETADTRRGVVHAAGQIQHHHEVGLDALRLAGRLGDVVGRGRRVVIHRDRQATRGRSRRRSGVPDLVGEGQVQVVLVCRTIDIWCRMVEWLEQLEAVLPSIRIGQAKGEDRIATGIVRTQRLAICTELIVERRTA